MSLDEAQNNLQNALVTTYLANLAFLSEYDNSLYQRVEMLSKEIDLNNYSERYFLEFIKDIGEFDIYDDKHDKYLYKKKANKYNHNIRKKYFFDSESQFTTLEPLLFIKNNKIKDKIFEPANEFLNIFNDDLSTSQKRKIKKIDKFVFLGTLLSRHIPIIMKKTKAKHVLICEDNLEIFRLSLFVFDYTLLVQNKGTVVFSIMDDVEVFDTKFALFYDNEYPLGHTLKYFSTNYNVSSYFDKIVTSIVSHSPLIVNYKTFYKEVIFPSFSKINKRNHLCINKESDNTFLKNKKVLFVGGGPSFSNNIQWIKNNQDLFIIVAMGATYKKLLDHDIRVDIISTLDTGEKLFEMQFKDVDFNKFTDTLIIESSGTHEIVDKLFIKNNLFVNPIYKSLHLSGDIQSSFSIGENTSTLLLQLGVDSLYLIGLDFSIDQKSGASHGKDSNSTTRDFDIKNITSSIEKGNFSLHGELIEVNGNMNKNVLTNRALYLSCITFGKNLDYLKNKKVYNFAKDGAYIRNTTFLDFNEFDNEINTKIDKESVFDELKEALLSKSESKLNKDEIKLLNLEKENLEEIIKKYFENEKEFKSLDEFYKFYNSVYKEIRYAKVKLSLSAFLLSNYFRIWLPYINYCFNDLKIKDEKRKIKEVSLLLNKQAKELIEEYLECLEMAFN